MANTPFPSDAACEAGPTLAGWVSPSATTWLRKGWDVVTGARRLLLATTLLLAGTLAVVARTRTSPGAEEQPPAKRPQKSSPNPVPPKRPRTDCFGDPLPEGALARLGSVRFRHPEMVDEVAFSPNGKLLAASTLGRGDVIIWDRATGHKLREIPIGDRGTPRRFRFSPDGKRLYNSLGYAWDVATGAKVKDLPPPPAEVIVMGYSPDGRESLLLQAHVEFIRWDIAQGKERGRYRKPFGTFRDLQVIALAGNRLLLPEHNGEKVTMWGLERTVRDIPRGKRLWSAPARRRKGCPVMAFSADGKLLAVGAPPGVISVYEAVSGKLLRRLQADVKGVCTSLSFNPDARTLAASNVDGSLRLWDLESGRQRVKIPRMQGWSTDVLFAPDSKVFATSGNGPHTVLLRETATGKPINPFPGHTSPISSMIFSPDGRTVATASSLRGDPVVRFWNPRNGRLLRRSLSAPSGRGVRAATFSPDGRSLAISDWTGENNVWIWDVRTGRVRYALAGHETSCTCLAFSPDGKCLASGDAYFNPKASHEGRLCIWDVEAGKLVREIRGTRGAIKQVLFTGDGRHLLAAANGVHVYDADSGQLDGEPFQAKSRVHRLALSGDGRLLATGDGQGHVRLWELATRREIPLAIPDAKGYCLDLSPDGRTLATSGPRGIILFHWPSGKIVGRLGGKGYKTTGVFSPDGRLLVTGAPHESSALVWDVSGLVNASLPAVARPAAADLRRWWAELAGARPGPAYQAVWRLAAAPEQAVPFLAEALQPVPAYEPARIARLIANLDSRKFRVREQASRELQQLGETVEDALRKTRKEDISLEQQFRIDKLLAQLTGPLPSPQQLRAIRAVAALEQIGGPEARKLLRRLAAGAAGARLTEEAKAALQRSKQG